MIHAISTGGLQSCITSVPFPFSIPRFHLLTHHTVLFPFCILRFHLCHTSHCPIPILHTQIPLRSHAPSCLLYTQVSNYLPQSAPPIAQGPYIDDGWDIVRCSGRVRAATVVPGVDEGSCDHLVSGGQEGILHHPHQPHREINSTVHSIHACTRVHLTCI